MPAFSAFLQHRSHDPLTKIFEIERLPFAFASKDKPVTSIPLSVLVQGRAQNPLFVSTCLIQGQRSLSD